MAMKQTPIEYSYNVVFDGDDDVETLIDKMIALDEEAFKEAKKTIQDICEQAQKFCDAWEQAQTWRQGKTLGH